MCERLEALGYVVHRAAASRKRFGTILRTVSNDVFGVYDLVAMGANDGVHVFRQSLWIQVTSSGAASSHRRKLEEFYRRVGMHEIVGRSRLLIYHAATDPGSRARWRCQVFDHGEWFDEDPGDLSLLTILDLKAREPRARSDKLTRRKAGG